MSPSNPHRRTDTTKKAAPNADWQPWSDAWTKHVPRLTDRTDLTVLVAPGAGGGAPECFYPALRRIEIDATYIADTPTVADPRRAGHKKIVPIGYGLLVHGCAHAAHSKASASQSLMRPLATPTQPACRRPSAGSATPPDAGRPAPGTRAHSHAYRRSGPRPS